MWKLLPAVQDGTLDESVLDKSCEEYLNVIFKYEENRDKNAVFQHEKDHETAREIEEECIVLLKNEDALLPLSADKKGGFYLANTPRNHAIRAAEVPTSTALKQNLQWTP